MSLFWPKNSKVVVVLDKESEEDRKYGSTLNETTQNKKLDLRVCYMEPYPQEMIHHWGKMRIKYRAICYSFEACLPPVLIEMKRKIDFVDEEHDNENEESGSLDDESKDEEPRIKDVLSNLSNAVSNVHGLAELGVDKGVIKNKKVLNDLIEREKGYRNGENASENESKVESSPEREEEEIASASRSETEDTQESDNDTENESEETESNSPETSTTFHS
ncbi:unnamed protein product, partial [Porites lobata]